MATDAYIFDAVRTPRAIGKAKTGSLHTVRPIDLLVTTLKALRDRNKLDTKAVEDVVVGCVTQAGEQGGCIARFAALAAGYDESVPGVTLNRYCASGQQAVHQAAAFVASGYADLMVAGGVESMSRVKMGSEGGAMWDPQTQWDIGSVPQGISADLLATMAGITRDDADSFAAESQNRAASAKDKGAFKRSIVAVTDMNGLELLSEDEYLRPGTTKEKLAGLKAAFQMIGEQYAIDQLTKRKYPQVEAIDHIHTAGNSSGIVDGAAAVIVASKEKGESLGLKARAKIKVAVSLGDEPVVMLRGPIPTTEMALKKAGMSASDIDLYEVNEAFAAVPIAFMRELGVPHDKVNVNGGAIALGHPLGATGAMLIGTLIDAMEDRNLATGAVTMCIGGGMGTTTILERV